MTLTSTFPRLLESDLYVCGPTPWLGGVVAAAHAAGMHPRQVHVERFDW